MSSETIRSNTSDKGHYPYKVNEIINGKYRVIKLWGDGTFGRVIECQELTTKEVFAMKIIRPVTRYLESAEIEAKINTIINKSDFLGKSHSVKLIDSFYFTHNNDRYYSMIYEKIGLSWFDFIKENNYRGYSIRTIKNFAYQLLEGIDYIHSLKIIHTDLKPENIWLVNSSFEIIKNKNHWPSNVLYKYNKTPSKSPSTRSYSKENERKEEYYNNPLYDEIKIIDFGGAVFKRGENNGIINTRQYRGPEVILGCCNWDEKSDVWSIGCILSELYTGELLFATHDNEEHLCLIEKECGPFPWWMVRNAEEEFKRIFTYNEEWGKYGSINYNKWTNKNKVKEACICHDSLKDIILDEHEDFRNWIKSLLTIDPDKRPTCSEALKHEFFKCEFQGK